MTKRTLKPGPTGGPSRLPVQNSASVPLPTASPADDSGGREGKTESMTPDALADADSTGGGKSADLAVALVEDDAGLRRSLERMLNLSPGCRCTCSCGTAEEALKVIPRNPPHVVLMDIHLPNRSGIECTALLRQHLPQVQVLMLTVYDDADTLFKALRAGACGYLLKRARPAEILEAIREVQRGGAPMSSEIARQVVAAFREPVAVGSQDQDLSRREQEILDHLLRGFANKEIGARLCISVFTVKNHLRHIYEKLHVRCRTDVLLRFREARREMGERPQA
jgi:DNA-binding NarL/FixJ family response regulator